MRKKITTLTVEHAKLRDFFVQLPLAGCKPTGRMRRIGTTPTGVRVRDVEVELPESWSGSMSETLYGLPGVRLMSTTMQLGRVNWFLKKILEFVDWHVMPSGRY